MSVLKEAGPWALLFAHFWARNEITAIIKADRCCLVRLRYRLLDIAMEITHFLVLFSALNCVFAFRER